MAVMTDTDFEQLLMLIVSGKSVSEASVELGYDDHGSALWFYLDDGADPSRRERYIMARRLAADAQFDQILDLENKTIQEAMSPQTLTAVVNARKWRLGKMNPKIYGDSQQLNLTSSDGSMSPAANASLVSLSFEELKKLAESLG